MAGGESLSPPDRSEWVTWEQMYRTPFEDEFDHVLTDTLGLQTRALPPNPFRPLSPFGYPDDELRGSNGPMTPGSLQDLLSLILQSMQPPAVPRPEIDGTRATGQQPYPFDLLSQLFNPGHAHHGDMVFTQEAFDRVMTQLMEQNQAGSAPPPASEEAINSLKKKNVDQEMLGTDGKAECSICMDNVELGEEMTVLPCKHWFHDRLRTRVSALNRVLRGDA
ncbi:hypothetical protein A1O3_07833 [Capronia epimyces CBS 606.96]|uniref:RING-type domain-containing protein n=1 Tax=Capronia epimyces CBS 606.96 TaxID=1182542 RepID=W9YB06_9EURO|nr:uncharacterized protein A1O3_07833 [Capronia epimyces CBS 606.96]EXJ79554.1 hypothetical protein A1O3_07833 [Capronia epimyces CBS 606.96]